MEKIRVVGNNEVVKLYYNNIVIALVKPENRAIYTHEYYQLLLAIFKTNRHRFLPIDVNSFYVSK